MAKVQEVPTSQVAPRSEPHQLVAGAPGYIKVRLTYLTPECLHGRSFQLREECDVQAPYTEEICVLMPCKKVHSLLESFYKVFKQLQRNGIVHQEAVLRKFQFLDEDRYTLSYLF